MLGVVIVAVPSISGGGSWMPHAACLLATACYGFAYEYLARFVVRAGQSPLVPTMWQLVFAAAILAPGLLLPGQLEATYSPSVVFGIVALGVIGSGPACVWNNLLVAEWSPTRAAMSMYVTPCVGVILGWLVLGESLTWNLPLGLAVVLGAVALDSRAAATAPSPAGPGREEAEALPAP
jgi:drug/metabolite transporter (DMT)-like permease